jgi:hypothetical protein
VLLSIVPMLDAGDDDSDASEKSDNQSIV